MTHSRHPPLSLPRCLLAFLSFLALLATAHAAAAAPVAPVPLRASPLNPCVLSTPDGVATFDLHRLRHASGYLASTLQLVHNEQTTYSYVFNVCANVTVPWSQCSGGSTAPAFQVQPPVSDLKAESVSMCKRLGSAASAAQWSLLDPRDPSRGVVLRYGGGEACRSSAGDKERQFSINFICADDANIPDRIDAAVDEGEGEQRCEYGVDFVTFYACPTQCPAYGKLLCNGGWCGMDRRLGRPRCFCREGWYGADCSATSAAIDAAEGCTALCILLAVCIALLSLFLVVASVVYWKVSVIVGKQQSMGLSQSASGGKRRAADDSHSTSSRIQLDALDLEPDGGSSADSALQRGGSGEMELQLQPQRTPRTGGSGVGTRQQSDAHLDQIDLSDDEEVNEL